MRKLFAVPFIVLGFLLLSYSVAAAHNGPPVETVDKLIHAKSSGSCDTGEWHFVITQVAEEDQAPATITVSFSDGVEDGQSGLWVLPLDDYTGHTAHYRLLTSYEYGPPFNWVYDGAATVIYGAWSGQFNLSHGPLTCEAPPSTTIPPVTTVPPTTVPPTTVPPTTVPPTTVPPVTSAPPSTTTPSVTETPTPTPAPEPQLGTEALPAAPEVLAFTGAYSALLGILGTVVFLIGVAFTLLGYKVRR